MRNLFGIFVHSLFKVIANSLLLTHIFVQSFAFLHASANNDFHGDSTVKKFVNKRLDKVLKKTDSSKKRSFNILSFLKKDKHKPSQAFIPVESGTSVVDFSDLHEEEGFKTFLEFLKTHLKNGGDLRYIPDDTGLMSLLEIIYSCEKIYGLYISNSKIFNYEFENDNLRVLAQSKNSNGLPEGYGYFIYKGHMREVFGTTKFVNGLPSGITMYKQLSFEFPADEGMTLDLVKSLDTNNNENNLNLNGSRFFVDITDTDGAPYGFFTKNKHRYGSAYFIRDNVGQPHITYFDHYVPHAIGATFKSSTMDVHQDGSILLVTPKGASSMPLESYVILPTGMVTHHYSNLTFSSVEPFYQISSGNACIATYNKDRILKGSWQK